MTRLRRAHPLAFLSAGLALAGLALAQQGGREPEAPEQEEELPRIEIPDLSGRSSAQEEMIRLFHEVEKALESIDIELADAGAGRIPPPEGRDSAIDRLLRSNGQKSDQVVSGMERILEIAQQMGGTCSSCMKPGDSAGQGQPEQKESPLDQERQRGPTPGEETPESPAMAKDARPEPSGEKPDDRGPNPPKGENKPSTPRQDVGGAPVGPGDDNERWGTLPERVRHVLQNQITDDVPLQYRDWIDSYYRRLNKNR